MLAHLSIRDIVLIRRLDITFEPGLSVLTGETGAGKSILLDALSLALGARGDAALVREGAREGQVTAMFDLPPDHEAFRILAEESLPGDGEMILRRVQGADGRSRVFINDQPASVALMRRIGRSLVEIHGQHDERALVDTDRHRDLLDAWADLGDLVARTGDAWTQWRAAERDLAALRARVEDNAREAEFLHASLDELDRLGPRQGEEEELAERRAAMMRAEKMAGEIGDAEALIARSDSPVAELSALLRRLSRKAPDAPELIDPILAPLDEALVSLDAVQEAISAALRAMEFDPGELEAAESRLFAPRAAARKHHVPVEELPALRDRFAAALEELDAGEERLGSLAEAARVARQAYEALASELSEARRRAAKGLAAAVMQELPALRLEKAEFFVECREEAPSAQGIDGIEFMVRTNPGSRPGPMMKVASGGELSRFLLARKVALADRGSAPTLVFDEIDTGVGGAVADAIGQRLARLADKVQVLSVTHAPQVAARASTHLLISKSVDADGFAVTAVQRIEDHSRSEEIARMLAGATVTDEARAAARRLLADTLTDSD